MHLSSPFRSVPTERKDPEGRRTWMKLLNRQEKGTGKNWEPKPHSRLCSVHFPDGGPTAETPTFNLGYSLFTPPPPNQPPPPQSAPPQSTPPPSARKRQTARPSTSETHVDEQSSSVVSTDYLNKTIINVKQT